MTDRHVPGCFAYAALLTLTGGIAGCDALRSDVPAVAYVVLAAAFAIGTAGVGMWGRRC